jgi:hypothetical protein
MVRLVLIERDGSLRLIEIVPLEKAAAGQLPCAAGARRFRRNDKSPALKYE